MMCKAHAIKLAQRTQELRQRDRGLLRTEQEHVATPACRNNCGDRKAELAAARSAGKLLGLFNTGNIDGALDRFFLKKGTVAKFPDQPDLTDQVRAALDIVSRNDKGFVLMVESGRIDKYSHSLDWERSVYDTIMLDNAVKIAKDFAAGVANEKYCNVPGAAPAICPSTSTAAFIRPKKLY